MKQVLAVMCVVAAMALLSVPSAHAADARAVVKTYADIAQAGYEDSLATAKTLSKAIDALIAKPSGQALKAAREAWVAARVPYQQTEVYRFGNSIVDDWEGKVNAWPLDEGLIDYVAKDYGTASDENPFYVVNVIANQSLKIGGKTIDAKTINADLLRKLHEVGDVEANVSTGYHAIEFLLWGQDLNGTGPGAGNRPHTDFDRDNCTNGNCGRRSAYLKAATELLISDLTEMVKHWQTGGKARRAVTSDPKKGLSVILTGMGSLSYGELAGERMKLGLLLHDPEEEHDCFSDNTHNSHYYDAAGIRNVYLGRYVRVDGKIVKGASIADLVRAANPKADNALRGRISATMAAMTVLKKRAETKERYDQMIDEGNVEGNKVVQGAIDALIAQTRAIETAVAALKLGKIEFEGSDSLDAPDKVGK